MEENFPRGGSNPQIGQKRKREQAHEEEDLFKSVTLEKTSSKKKKPSKTEKERKKVLKQEDKKSFREVLTAGSLVLGCVKEILEFELVVSLPGSLKGTVIITNVSSAYTEQLNKLSQLNGDAFVEAEAGIPALSELFHVGMLVRCKIVEVDANANGRKAIKLSVNPKDINSEITAVRTGLVLVGAVSSIEDHGYVVDLGVKGLMAFINKKSAAAYLEAVNEDNKTQLCVGELIHCLSSSDELVNMATDECRTVTITADPRTVHRSMVTENMNLTLQQMLPGLVAKCTITKVSDAGLKVQFLKFNGFVSSNHLELETGKYSSGQEIKLSVLYVHPVTKVIHLSQLTHLVTPDLSPRQLFGKTKFGDVVDCDVIRVVKDHGVYLKLNKIVCFCSTKHIDVQEDIYNSFKKGSSRKCRIVSFNHLDRQMIVSCKKSILEQEIFSYDDLKPAMLVECTIKKYMKKGVIVKISSYLNGYIPIAHLSEVPLKHPEKKYPVGKKLKCKVLQVNPAENRVNLTHKKSLVRSAYDEIVSYSQLRAGVVVEGCVAVVKPEGLLVTFYDNVKTHKFREKITAGWVPSKELGLSVTDCDPTRIFYIGQTVPVRVISCNPQENKLILSLKLDDDRQARAVTQLPEGIHIGLVCGCRVLSIEKEGLMVDLLVGNHKAFLPSQHLSDHVTLCTQILSVAHPGDVLDNVMIIRVDKGQLIVTRKSSIVQSSINITDLDKLQVDLVLPGYVKTKMPYGLFVTVGGFTGLVPNKMISDRRHENIQSLVGEGQSVNARVMEVDRETKRVLLSTKMSACNDSSDGLELLADYLTEYKLLLSKLSTESGVKQKLSKVHVGDVVNLKVTEMRDEGVLCDVENHAAVRGIITLDNMTGITCKKGDRLKGVVLHIDLMSECVQLSVNPEVVKAVENYVSNKFTQARVDQTIKSEVQLITEDFVLVLLKTHASGLLAYLPAKRHMNDFTERGKFNVGQVNPVVIKQILDGTILASLEIHEASSGESSSKSKRRKQKEMGEDLLPIGSIHTARVTGVTKVQMNIKIGDVTARVHVSQVVDGETSVNPLSAYYVGVEVPVKILAYREHKSFRILPITRGVLSKIVLDCTMKPSLMIRPSSELISINPEIKVGDQTVGYVISHDQKFIHMAISPDLNGNVHILNVSNDIQVLGNVSERYKLGSGHLVRVLGAVQRQGYLDLSLVDRGERLKPGDTVPGLVTHCSETQGLKVQLPNHHTGVTDYNSVCDDSAVRKRLVKALQPDCFITCHLVNAADKNGLVWNIKLDLTGIQTAGEISLPCLKQKKKLKRKRRDSMNSVLSEEDFTLAETNVVKKNSKSESVTKKIKIDESPSQLKIVTFKNQSQPAVKKEKPQLEDSKSKKVSDTQCLSSVGFSWSDSFTPSTDPVQALDSDDDSGYEGIQVAGEKSKKVKLSEKEEAKKLLQAEAELLDGTRQPQSVAEFDRLVIQSPNSSLVWLRYVSFHLELTEIDKARAVAERALKTISFREEQEKLNVWLGYLNMETMYGTQESTTKLLNRAIKLNDSFKVLKSMVEIYIRANKNEAAEDLCNTLRKRFKHNTESWIQSFHVYFINAKPEEARKLLDRSLQTVDKKTHSKNSNVWIYYDVDIELLNKFSQLEWKYSSADRAKTLFKTILSNYPKRTDLWSIYLDACVKHGDVEEARQSYEEVTSSEMNAKKLGFLFKKFIEFEKKFGTDDTLLAAKQKAFNYADAKLT